MTESKRKAGEYILEYFKISKIDNQGKSIDISALIHHWNLVESLDSGFIQGSAQIYDAVGLIDKFTDEEGGWLKGEEEIEISYTDFFGTTNTETYFLYSITDLQSVRKSNEAFYEYKIHFVSKEKLYSAQQNVKKGFRDGYISEYVQEVFDQYFETDKSIDIQDTETIQNLVVPDYDPFQTMQFFARKAFVSEDAQNTFRFFENREGFYFKTLEQLVIDDLEEMDGASATSRVSQRPTFQTSEYQDQTPDGQHKLMTSLLALEFPSYVNTFEDINQGGYYSRVNEIDFINRTIIENEYEYLDEYQQYWFPDNDHRTKHSKRFADEYMNNHRDVLVLKDYEINSAPGVRGDPHYVEAYNNKNVSLYHHQNEMAKIKVYGRNTINAGDLITLNLFEINFDVGNRTPDKKRSGLYIVESAESMFYENSYIQTLMISKAGLNEPAETAGDRRETENSGAEEDGTSRPENPAGSPPPPSPGQLGNDELSTLATDAGFNSEEARVMAAIARAESSGNPSALNDNSGTGDLSYGLWQINMIGGIGPERSSALGLDSYSDLYTPQTNARAAKHVYDQQGFEAWSVYKNGSYKRYLD